MKLVMCYTVSDGCTYSNNITTPIEYKSEEDLLCDFADALKKAIKMNKSFFKFLNQEYNVFNFCDEKQVTLPGIMTLDDWFEVNKIQ